MCAVYLHSPRPVKGYQKNKLKKERETMNEMKENKKLNIRAMVFTAIVAALICVASPFSIPLPGLVPISLGTFAI